MPRRKGRALSKAGGRGRAHVPTAASRETVRTMAAIGVRKEDIAAGLGIAKSTLESRYRDELAQGVREARGKVLETLFRMATSGTCPSATIFWVKTREGWKETQTVEHSGKDGAPLAPAVIVLPPEDPEP